MSKLSNSAENFYNSIKKHQQDINIIFGDTINIEDTNFYELCKKFSDIGLNAPKRVIEATYDVQGCFQDEDMNIAKLETVKFINYWKITEIDLLLELICKMHQFAVDWEDSRQKSTLVMRNRYDHNFGYVGKYHNFSKLPQELFDKLCNDIKATLLNNN